MKPVGRLMQVLLRPHLSEKSTLVAEKNRQYVFCVVSDATKPEIKQAVEAMFAVKVNDVQVANVKGKKRNFRQMAGARKGWKKAYVSLQEGYDIDFTGTK